MNYIKRFKIFEGRYDKLSTLVSSEILKKWKSDFILGLTKSTFMSSYATADIEMDIKAVLLSKPGIGRVV